jgi:NAD-dependent SIR2 family protein deacetylase
MIQANDPLAAAAATIAAADALLITAGAGMGADSGLPDFRSPAGFWNSYPAYDRLGIRFEELANPSQFHRDARLAWGFYGHRLDLYRKTRPHEGYRALLQMAESRPGGYFVFTSNIDGHFAKAGFDPARVVECHGSIHFLQCSAPCQAEIWPADDVHITVDQNTMQAVGTLPSCPECGLVARPNVLMFDDFTWLHERTATNWAAYRRWQGALAPGRLAIMEIGAGKAVPTIRAESKRVSEQNRARLIRINLRESNVPPGHLGIPMRAVEALPRLAEQIPPASNSR